MSNTLANRQVANPMLHHFGLTTCNMRGCYPATLSNATTTKAREGAFLSAKGAE
jgi:hypothetical protein